MAPTGALWAPLALRLARQALNKATKLVKARLDQVSKATGGASTSLEPVLARVNPRQPISRAAAIRQNAGKGRWYTTHSTINASIRRYMSSGQAGTPRINRSTFPTSAVGTSVIRSTARAPFASTLRPNLTGGALPRTAGGYSLGGGRTGGVRHFSHTPAAPAQVINNVNAAVRAFWLSGSKAQFDGMTPNGEQRFRAVSNLQAETTSKIQSIPKFAPGSYIDFQVSPTVTALSPLGAQFPYTAKTQAPTLNTSGFLDVLSVDFSRSLKDLVAVMSDLKKLATLGDLTIEMAGPSTIRVRFPGCDADSVERLCEEVCVTRGIVHQDIDFDSSSGVQVALMFPFAPTSEHTLSSPGGSLMNQTGHELHEFEDYSQVGDNPWIHSPEGYESLEDISDTESMYFAKAGEQALSTSDSYSGVEGIYKFIEECDNAQRRGLRL